MIIKKQILLTYIMLLGIASVQAQTSANSSGGETSGSGGTLSYSVGQVVYQANTGTNGSVAEGVQQSYEISVITAVEEAKGINLSVSAYPNPTTDYLTLEIKEFDFSNLHFKLYNLNGKILQGGKITGNQTNIIMSNLVPATYFVKVVKTSLNLSQEVKSFKIIKQ